MRIFAIADLHLSTYRPKPMAIFGPAWQNHPESLFAAWRQAVGDDDLVLIAGDISWAMRLDEVQPDLALISALPGEKAMVRGNHDYWWNSIGRVRRCAPPRLHFIQNDAFCWRGVAVAGTRLWDFPELAWPATTDAIAGPVAAVSAKSGRVEPDPDAIRRRELERLRLSLSCLPADAYPRIALLHYPPVAADGRGLAAIVALFAEYKVNICVFGHIHGLAAPLPVGADCLLGTTRCLLTSCDGVGFRPKLIWHDD